MTRLAAIALLLASLPAPPARAAETLAVVAVAEPPAGPDADLAELTHQLRAACRDRVGGVLEVPTMRARFLGQASNATLPELDRAYGGALAVYQNGEFESALRTLRAIVEDLESIPESEEAYSQWTRALLRLAHAAATIGQRQLADEALVKLLTVDPAFQPDPDQYSPGYRRRLDELRARVRALPRRRLTVVSEGRAGTVYVNGRPFGEASATITLPAGRYRVGGAAGALRVPSFEVDLREDDRTVALDFSLAEALRVNAGPGLAVGGPARGYAIVRAGAWLGADKLVVASRATEGGAQFLLGSIYDVRRGALLREGSVRMVAGSVPSVNLGALAAFLLTGQSSREVKDRTPEGPHEVQPAAPPPAAAREEAQPPAPVPAPASAHGPAPGARATAEGVPPAREAAAAKGLDLAPARPAAGASAPGALFVPLAPAPAAPIAAGPEGHGGSGRPVPRPWMRPAAIGAGVLAAGCGALSVQQAVQSSRAYRDAGAMVGAGGVLLAGSDPARYRDLLDRGDGAKRNAWIAAGTAVVFAATAGVLGWLSRDGRPAEPGIRF